MIPTQPRASHRRRVRPGSRPLPVTPRWLCPQAEVLSPVHVQCGPAKARSPAGGPPARAAGSSLAIFPHTPAARVSQKCD